MGAGAPTPWHAHRGLHGGPRKEPGRWCAPGVPARPGAHSVLRVKRPETAMENIAPRSAGCVPNGAVSQAANASSQAIVNASDTSLQVPDPAVLSMLRHEHDCVYLPQDELKEFGWEAVRFVAGIAATVIATRIVWHFMNPFKEEEHRVSESL